MNSLPLLKPAAPAASAHAHLPLELAGCGASIEALYLHVPFCTSKCHYCDFYSLAGHLDRADPFLDALEREILLHKNHFGPIAPRTIFVGGGTPTLLAPEQLD